MRLVLPRDWQNGAPKPDGIQLFIDGHKIEGVHSVTLPINMAHPYVMIDVKLVPMSGLVIEYAEAA